jgi:hypothetical protein
LVFSLNEKSKIAANWDDDGHSNGARIMKNSADATLVTDIARDILTEVAPQEMPIFPAASRAYFADPAAALKKSRSRDYVLSFGIDGLSVLLTPAVLYILSEVLPFLTRIAKKAAEDGLAKEIPDIVKAMFRKFQSSEPRIPPVLTRKQIGLIHGNVLLAAKKLRLPVDKAQSLANAVTAQLVLPKK